MRLSITRIRHQLGPLVVSPNLADCSIIITAKRPNGHAKPRCSSVKGRGFHRLRIRHATMGDIGLEGVKCRLQPLRPEKVLLVFCHPDYETSLPERVGLLCIGHDAQRLTDAKQTCPLLRARASCILPGIGLGSFSL